MSRPCHCDRTVRGEPFDRSRDCPRCWLWHNEPDCPTVRVWKGLPVTTVVTVAASPPVESDPSKWPRLARLVHRRRRPGERGVGDTIERLLGASGERFKVWFKRITGYDCGCDDRRDKLNASYPYS